MKTETKVLMCAYEWVCERERQRERVDERLRKKICVSSSVIERESV